MAYVQKKGRQGMVQTIDDVIANLKARGDARLDWWQRIKTLIELKKYESAFAMLSDHTDDYDYCEQVKIVSKAIVAN